MYDLKIPHAKHSNEISRIIEMTDTCDVIHIFFLLAFNFLKHYRVGIIVSIVLDPIRVAVEMTVNVRNE